jgi:hypothetical protein
MVLQDPGIPIRERRGTAPAQKNPKLFDDVHPISAQWHPARNIQNKKQPAPARSALNRTAAHADFTVCLSVTDAFLRS